MNKSRLSAAVCAGIITLITIAPALSAPVFPREIQACITGGVCTKPVLQFDSPDMVVYQYSENTTLKALIGYDLKTGSKEIFPDNTSRVLGGPVWMSANQFYDLSEERHFFTLYLDQVIPQPQNWWVLDSDGLDVGLSLTTADLLGGSGFFHMGELGNFFLEGELGTLGDLGQGGYPNADNHSFLPCLADTCEVGAEFNLINLAYVVSGSQAALTVDLTDNRKLLYSQFIGFEGEQAFQNYYVKPIPLPAAAWLFGSGLLGMIGIARRKKVA